MRPLVVICKFRPAKSALKIVHDFVHHISRVEDAAMLGRKRGKRS